GVTLHSSIHPYLTPENFLKVTLVYVVTGVPFFFTGLLLSVVFARRAGRIAQLYGADLAGGALACLVMVPLLNWIGAPNTILLASLGMAGASAVWAEDRVRRNSGLLLAAVIAVLLVANRSGALLDVERDHRFATLFSRWNALSQVVVQQRGEARYIVIDRAADTAIMNVDPRKAQQASWSEGLFWSVPAVANVLRPKGAYAIIGPGGGVDVLRAVAAGSPRVTGIEINPTIATTIMRGQFAQYAYHLYELPEVTIHVAEGRSFLRQSRERFDVVQMTLVDTWATTSAGAFALSENNLYTVEAFQEYFEHLEPDGFIAVTRWEFRQPREALRVVSQAMEALQRVGVEQVSGHFLVISEGPLDEDGRAVTVLAKRSPFTAEEEARVRAHMAKSGRLRMIYSPSDPGTSAFADLVKSGNASAFARGYAYNVEPVTDDRPFFFFTLKTGQALERVLTGTGRGMDWKVNLGVVVLALLLAISVVAVAAFLVVPLWVHAGRPGTSALHLAYFVAIGLGYILVEIALIQRFVLFLGHPTYALTVVVFLMLLGSGAGSVVSGRWLSPVTRVRAALAVIVAMAAALTAFLPGLMAAGVGWPFALKWLLSAALLGPLGFAMGMPFPTGLRAMAERGEAALEWAYAMNAGASVLGSVLAIVIAIHFGLGVTLGAGALAYILAAAGTLGWAKAEG
ncbi:MAG: hypothetical protein ACRD2R_09760, partial [Terriglobales bacterium]